MANKLPNAATTQELLGFARRLFPKPDDLVEIRYEQFSHGVRATLVVTARIYNSISDEATHELLDLVAEKMQDRGVGGGNRPFVILQTAKR